MGMRSARSRPATLTPVQAPDKKILHGSGRQAVVRLIVYDNKAPHGQRDRRQHHQMKARPRRSIIWCKRLFGVVVVLLLVVVIMRSGGKKRGPAAGTRHGRRHALRRRRLARRPWRRHGPAPLWGRPGFMPPGYGAAPAMGPPRLWGRPGYGAAPLPARPYAPAPPPYRPRAAPAPAPASPSFSGTNLLASRRLRAIAAAPPNPYGAAP